VSLVNAPQVPGQVFNVVPVLQAQDGSFVGSVDTDGGSPMAAFDAIGNVRWAVPNDQPQIATADGGVIGQSGITYDSSGNAPGQLGSMPTYSWTGNAYRVGSIDDWLPNILKPRVALGYSPFAASNYSSNYTSVLLDWFPILDAVSYTDIHNALTDLLAKLATNAVGTLAQQEVFNLLGNDAQGNRLTTAGFIKYLKVKPPGFFDGLRSGYCYDSLSDSYLDALCLVWGSGFWLNSVALHFNTSPGDTAVTGTPSNPLLTFFRPSSILSDNSGMNPVNEAVILHEALHGFTGQFDLGIASALNVSMPSCNITQYIEANVLSHLPPTGCQQ